MQPSLLVVEVGGGAETAAGAAYCARVFAEFGAQVFRLGEFDDSPAQPRTPAEQTLAAWRQWLDTGKLTASADEHARILARADVVLDGRSPDRRRAEPLQVGGHCVVIALSWFGEDGPYAAHAGADFVCRAMAGLVKLCGPAGGPPLAIPDFQVEIMAGLAAFTAAACGVYAGSGRRMQLSAHEAAVAFAEYQLAQIDTLGPARRLGVNVFRPTFPASVYRCSDGWIGVTVVTHAQWQTCCALLGLEELGHDARYITAVGRMQDRERLEALLQPRFLTRPASEWFALARERKLPWVVVPDMAALVDTPELAQRGAFTAMDLEGQPDAARPDAARPFAAQPATTQPDAARPFAARPFVAPSLPFRPQPGTALQSVAGARRQSAPGLPLQGLRVVDLSMGWAGPLATRQLADLGAEVIKVEACSYTDWWRGHDPRPEFLEQRGYEKSSWFNAMNRNKEGITLDLSSEDGRAMVRRLVRTADVVVENYAPDVLPKFGLDYSCLVHENPALVMLSLPAFSAQSPWQDVRAYGSTLEHACGLPHLTGNAQDAPTMNHLAYGDANGGLNGAAAVMAALLERRQTGRGRHLDLSQVQAMLPLTAFWMIHHTLHGEAAPRQGARHPVHAPHGCFRCVGDDAWLALAVTTDAQWRALCQVLDDADLAGDPALAHAAGRKAHENRIETSLSAWCGARTVAQAAQAMNAAGIPAGEVVAPGDLPQDEHLLARGFWQRVERPYVAPQMQASAPFREGPRPFPARSPAPTLGQHNDAVLARVLGMAQHEIDALYASCVMGTVATGAKIHSRMQARAASQPNDVAAAN